MNIIGIEIDLFSLIPAIFASVLSIYNWYQLRKPADIYANDVISYGLVSSSYHGGYQLCIPLILHNEGAIRGMVTNIRIGFSYNDSVTLLEILGKARLLENDVNKVYNFDWDTFENEGYSMILPTYPITVEGLSSTDVVVIAQASEEDSIIPIGVKTTCTIEVQFGRNKVNTTKFPFFLSKEKADTDNSLAWYVPVEI